MKTHIIKSILLLILSFGLQSSSYINSSSANITIKATFDGYDDIGYAFSYEEKEVIKTLTFEDVKEELIKKYDLDNDTNIGKKFELVYSIEESEDDFEDEQTLILKSLKLLEE